MGEVGRDHWRPPGPTSLLKQNLLENNIRDCVQIAFDYLQESRLERFTSEELCCFPKNWWSLHSNLCLYIQKSPHLARKYNKNPGVALEIISLHDVRSQLNWERVKLLCQELFVRLCRLGWWSQARQISYRLQRHIWTLSQFLCKNYE